MAKVERELTLEDVREQIDRYFTAVHGKDYVYRAPETFRNIVERWLLGIASGDLDYANEQIETIVAFQARPSTGRERESER